MKKSLLVVPALGVMLLAAAGSVGGTVAWFSSVSSVQAAANAFQAVALDGNLEITHTVGKGTALIDSNHPEQGVKLLDNCKLTHASYDPDDKTIYTISNEAATKVRRVDEANSSNWIARSKYDGTDNHDIYWAASWDVTLTYRFATETYANLYFDASATGSKISQTAETDATKDTIRGFRIAFVPATGSTADNVVNTRVWANKREATKYVKNEKVIEEAKKTAPATPADCSTGVDFDTDRLINNSTINKKPEGVAVTENGGVDWLGQFKNESHNNAVSVIKFTCVAWFEGTDADVISAAEKPEIAASLKFYIREATTEATAS